MQSNAHFLPKTTPSVNQSAYRSVSEEDVERARKHGADDKAIHDTILVAAAFGMYNRYVDGLDTPTPDDEKVYDEHGKDLATNGYTAVVE